MFVTLMIVLFVVVPVAELWLILAVAEWLGGGLEGAVVTIALLIASSLLGALLLRSQGLAVWSRFLQAMRERRVPHREVIDGLFVAAGGALLLTPGFLTDLVGLAMLVPPTRALLAGIVSRRIAKRVMGAAGVEGWQWQAGTTSSPGGPHRNPPSDDDVVDAVAVEEEIEFRFSEKRLEGN